MKVAGRLKIYVCEKCNTQYRAKDKYELAEQVPHVDFGMDIEEYDEDDTRINVISECDVCFERPDEVPYEPKDVG